MAKRYVSEKVTLISEEIKPVPLAIIELRLSEDITQSVGRSVGQTVSQQKIPLNKKLLKFILTWW